MHTTPSPPAQTTNQHGSQFCEICMRTIGGRSGREYATQYPSEGRRFHQCLDRADCEANRSTHRTAFEGPPCGVDQTKPDVDVCKDVRGVWWVTLDGVKVSDHRTHDAARIAARRHQVELMSK